jgi:hypothetical protein
MSKKIVLFIKISFFVILIFMPIASVSATSVYVGVTIANTENPEGEAFCLLEGTKMSVWSGGTQKGSTVTISSDICIGDNIWSGLVDLESGQSYSIKLENLNCNGKIDSRQVNGQPNDYCWYGGDFNQNCTTVCSANNTTTLPDSGCIETDPDCVILTAFFGGGHTCYNGDAFPMLYIGDNQFKNGVGSSGDWCSYSSGYHKRICACVMSYTNFIFPFTASF